MHVVVQGCTGLNVHKDTEVACLRAPGPNGARDSRVRRR